MPNAGSKITTKSGGRVLTARKLSTITLHNGNPQNRVLMIKPLDLDVINVMKSKCGKHIASRVTGCAWLGSLQNANFYSQDRKYIAIVPFPGFNVAPPQMYFDHFRIMK